ncbi:ankyrin [Pluteus cervinus]|uniref:Ankyrin n=1 Tax=Pluteus cervinus TaxID=181527 RepID=A0ACD3BD76_9AGAR|nr:ankyrin [Pluteus cervinus]
MAEKDATARLQRAVKENNLFLVKRLIQRTDMRNIDTAPARYTSLAWAAVLGHEETFEFLLSAGHDDEELSKDSENNTILMLLADLKPPAIDPYANQPPNDIMDAALRMARLYYDRYCYILDWSNLQGKTALHLAALKGNEELVRMFCDLGADFDLADNQGNTPLHYASAWGHIPIVQLLIERGCQYTARNNEGFTASDYAYSFSTRDTLQDSARNQYEHNKRSRRHIFAQAAARGSEWVKNSTVVHTPIVSTKFHASPRTRSGSGTSRTTATSDSGEMEHNSLAPGPRSQSSLSSSPSQPSGLSSSFFSVQAHHAGHMPSTSSIATFNSSSTSHLNAITTVSTLSPIATRMRERDLDAMEKYMRRNRSGSGTSSTENKPHQLNFSSAGPSANGDDITSLDRIPKAGTTTPRRLRSSVSAAQLRTAYESSSSSAAQEIRTRSGTNPGTSRPTLSPLPAMARSTSASHEVRSALNDRTDDDDSQNYTGPPSQYAKFPDPPASTADTTAPIPTSRRKPFHLLSKPLPGLDSTTSSHRRGMSATSVRGA